MAAARANVPVNPTLWPCYMKAKACRASPSPLEQDPLEDFEKADRRHETIVSISGSGGDRNTRVDLLSAPGGPSAATGGGTGENTSTGRSALAV